MQGGSKSKCASGSHQILLDNAKNRIVDLQEKFNNLRAARREGQANDVVVLEEQVNQLLREWDSELSAPSPASSLLGGNFESFSEEIRRLLLSEEEDDATSALPDLAMLTPQAVQSLDPGAMTTFQEDYFVNNEPQEHCFQGSDKCKGSVSDLHDTVVSTSESMSQLNYHQFKFQQESEHGLLFCSNGTEEDEQYAGPNISPITIPPPSAFLGPKCALWDCTRPALGSDWYCSSFHATLASSENSPGMNPVLRPGGISLKDSLLFLAVSAKAQGKNVGIPECEGAATAKSPWNATELFDTSLLEGERIREWLFFDTHRRAFESGTRKQRSLPDHVGRGWHESRKQVVKEFGGHKRSYYMDPQPCGCFEWHLFEYEINSCDAYALYRLEVKFVTGKKSPKGKAMKDSLADLQKKMGRLTAEIPADDEPSLKGQRKGNGKVDSANITGSQNEMISTTVPVRYGLNGPNNSSR